MGQTGSNVIGAMKVEGTYNTAPGASGATQMRLIDSPGFTLEMANFRSAERRSDMLDTMARMGTRRVPGAFNSEMIVGAHDTWFEAVMRGTWTAAQTITVDGGAALTSFEVLSTSTFQFAGTTTPIAAGLNVGDVFRFANMSTAANNSKNIRVKSISGSVVTVHGTPLTIQAADSAASLTIWKKLVNPATPTRRTFYYDQYEVDNDVSAVIGGVRWLGMNIQAASNGMTRIAWGALGADMTPLESGDSPYYSSPTLPTGDPLVFADATLSLGGSDIVNVVSLDINYLIAAETVDVNGGSASPDIYDGKATLGGTITMTRNDLSKLTAYRAETEYELHVLFVEPESEPKDGIAFFLPRVKLTGATAPFVGGDGAKIETLPFTCGVKEGAAATGYDSTLLAILTSAAP